MPTIAYVDDNEEEEIKQYTSCLFSTLIREQLLNSGQVDETAIETNPDLDFLNCQLSSALMKQIGRDLNAISIEFARSSERNRVLEQAQHVEIDHINYDDFRQFLEELFVDGITRERIVVLFFFCSDVVVRAYNNRLASFKRLFNWFLNYILNRICGWIANHGGWKVVLGTYVPAVSQTVFYWLGSAAIVMFMYKKIFQY